MSLPDLGLDLGSHDNSGGGEGSSLGGVAGPFLLYSLLGLLTMSSGVFLEYFWIILATLYEVVVLGGDGGYGTAPCFQLYRLMRSQSFINVTASV